jgi:hypothetical protein
MSEEQIVDTGVTETPTDSAPVEQTTSDPSKSVTVDDTTVEGKDDPMIPKSRFDEINAQLKESKERLQKYEGVNTNDLLEARSTSQEAKDTGVSEEKTLKELQALKDKVELNEVKAKYPDMDNYAKKMAEFIRKEPHASWETAYKSVKFDDLENNARQEGREEAYQNIEQKKKASGESPSTHKMPPSNLSKVETMLASKNTSLSDIEKMLPRG